MCREGLLCYAMSGLEARKRADLTTMAQGDSCPHKNSTYVFKQWKTEGALFSLICEEKQPPSTKEDSRIYP